MKKLLDTGRIYHADCREALPKVSSSSVRLIHTSPPYNIGRSYSAYADSKPLREYREFLQNVIAECFRTLLPGGSMFWQTGYTSETDAAEYIYPLDHLTFELFLESGFRLKDRIIWRYFGGMAFKKKFTNKHETILWWVKPGAETLFDVFPVREKSKEYDSRNNLFGRNPGNVWEVDRVAYGSSEQTSHIAVFPEEISERIVLSASNAGDVCLDPFSGSGTLCKVARSRGRKYLGIELDSHYVKESEMRLRYCQPDEFDNVLSQVIKDHVFGGKTITLDSDEIADRLQVLLERPGSAKLTDFLEHGEMDRIASFQDGGIPKARKAAIWKSLDGYFEGNLLNDPVRLVDSSYLSSFRLNRAYNSVMRLALAWRWLHAFAKLPNKHLPSRVERIASEETSSYKLRGSRVSLSNYEREIKAPGANGNGQPKPSRELILDL